MTMLAAIKNSAIGRRLGGFAADRRGVSAVEFAMLLPLMVTLYLSCAEITQGVAIDRKVTLTSRALADLSTQVSNIPNAEMTNIMNAAAAVMAPFATTPLKITLTCIDIDSSGNAKVKWSDTLGGTARAVGSSVTMPSALKIPSTSMVWAEVSYGYTPAIGHTITGTLTLSDQIYMRPRISDTITRS